MIDWAIFTLMSFMANMAALVYIVRYDPKPESPAGIIAASVFVCGFVMMMAGIACMTFEVSGFWERLK